MSEHRRKPPPPAGGRAAARRAAQQSSGRRAAPPRGSAAGPASPQAEPERPYGGRAEARRAAQRGGRRRAAEPATMAEGGGRGGRRGSGGGRRGGEPPKKRFVDYPRAGRYGWKRWVPSWRLVTGTGIGFFGALVAAAGISYAMVGVPNMADSAKAQNNVYYWANGKPMVAAGGSATNRQIVDYDDIPKYMRYAVMSAENKTFETDSGVDPMGIARALFNMAKGGETQGGSTITQQYVKNAMLDDQSQSISRKFKELFISIKVGAEVPKDEIMRNYLNTAYYGRGAYGIQAAARTYFNKDASKLDPSQCAFLASMLKGATYYDPAGNAAIDPVNATPDKNRKRAEARWSWILSEEKKDHPSERAKLSRYTSFPKVQAPHSSGQLSGQIGYLVDLANAYVENHSGISEKQLQRGGYEIHTTFDKAKVDKLSRAVENVRKKNIDPKKRPDKDTYVQFGGASVSPKNGAIQAIYGGEDATKHFTDNADVTGAQVGSTFKPFVLAAALRDGVRDPDGPKDQPASMRTPVSLKSLYSGKNNLKIKNYDGTTWTDKKGREWLQANDGHESVNPPSYLVDLRRAMMLSTNSVYVQLGMDVGLDKVKQSAIDAGISPDSLTGAADYPSFSIGTTDPSAIRMAGAYGTFANQGQQNDPYSVEYVKREGDEVYRHHEQTKAAFDPKVANNVTDVLKSVVDGGTGTNAQLPGRQVAGKTGTTDGNKSAWFVGYTPQLSTAITMYRYDDNAKSQGRKFLEMYGTGGQDKIHGASFPSEIWHDYMANALAGTKAVNFPAPEPIGSVVGLHSPSPTPSPSASHSDEPSHSPSPSTSASGSGQPSPSDTCSPWDVACKNQTGGDDGGGQTGGDTGGPSSDPSTEPPGQDNGGWWGGGG
ncbi:transglycosylase domain-containing protein [Streptomyces sp. NPDC059740]|uniref:transglycosylase domain-containing protein n=1 Tax=Streptomyces sp. NPDC059740 TaxID=3346926 RepID=UPI003650F223